MANKVLDYYRLAPPQATVAAVRTVDTTAFISTGVLISCVETEAVYVWDQASVDPDDGGVTTIAPTVGPGRWKNVNNGQAVSRQAAYDGGPEVDLSDSIPMQTRSFLKSVEQAGITITNGGTGYSVGEILTVVGGTGTAATILVSIVSGGVITQAILVGGGSYSVVPTNPVSTTGSVNDDATFTLTFHPVNNLLVQDTTQSRGGIIAGGTSDVSSEALAPYISLSSRAKGGDGGYIQLASIDSAARDRIKALAPSNGLLGYNPNLGRFETFVALNEKQLAFIDDIPSLSSHQISLIGSRSLEEGDIGALISDGNGASDITLPASGDISLGTDISFMIWEPAFIPMKVIAPAGVTLIDNTLTRSTIETVGNGTAMMIVRSGGNTDQWLVIRLNTDDEATLVTSSRDININDFNRQLQCRNNVGPITLTLNGTLGSQIGQRLEVIRTDVSAFPVTIQAAGGVMINGVLGGSFVVNQYSTAFISVELATPSHRWTISSTDDAFDLSDLPAANPLVGADITIVEQGGTNKQASMDQIKAYVEDDDVSPAFGIIGFTGNSTETVISDIDTPAKVSGIYLDGELDAFTFSTDRLIYNDPLTRKFDIEIEATLSLDQVNAKVTVYIAKNGTVVSTFKKSIDLDGVTPSFKAIVVTDIIELDDTDYVEVFIENNTSDEDITVQDLTLKVGAPGFTGSASSEDSNIFTQTEAINVVQNTDVESQLNGTGVGSFSIPANSLSAGDKFLVNLSGQVSQNLSGAPNDQVSLKLSDGANIFLETNMERLLGGQTLRDYTAYLIIHVQEIGPAGVARIHSAITMPFFYLVNEHTNILYKNSTTFDTTVDINLTLTVQFNIASPNNKITSELFSMVKI